MYKIISIIFFSLVLIMSCKNLNNNELREGDLLFQNLNCGELCEAIEAVTTGVDGKDFSHCALVVKINDSLKVIEAIGSKVQLNSIETFYRRSGDLDSVKNITVGRLKKQFQYLIPKTIFFAKQQISKDYDEEFLINNNKLYCSELIYESLKYANNDKDFLTLEPMTFKNPKTNEFFLAWVNYYKTLNCQIPEGKLGINPGLISRSNKIEVVTINK